MERKATLKAWRVNAGLSQRDLGDSIGRSEATIANWEKGKHHPDAVEIAKIEKALNINWSNDVLLPEELRETEK